MYACRSKLLRPNHDHVQVHCRGEESKSIKACEIEGKLAPRLSRKEGRCNDASSDRHLGNKDGRHLILSSQLSFASFDREKYSRSRLDFFSFFPCFNRHASKDEKADD